MKHPVEIKAQEKSFTLLEVIIAVGLLTAVVIQMATGQGALFGMLEYGEKSNQAMWLAKRIMSEVEYNWTNLEFKELETSSSIKDAPFKDVPNDFEFLYSLDIHEWKLPLFDLLTKGGPQGEGEDGEKKKKTSSNPAGDFGGLDEAVNNIFEGQILKIAHVEVSWPAGARRDSVSLTYLLTNEKKLDEYIITKKGAWDTLLKKAAGNQIPKNGGGAGGAQTPPPPPPSPNPDDSGNDVPPPAEGG